MGSTDRKEKAYLSNKSRYADLWNGGVFHGAQIIRPEELEDMNTVQVYTESGESVELLADLMMKETRDQLLACLITENQQEIDYSIPVKIILQEALEYYRQAKEIKAHNRESYAKIEPIHPLRWKGYYQSVGEYLYHFKKQDRLKPVSTLIVYWGEEEWDGPASLHELIDFGSDPEFAEAMKKLVPEYPLHVLNLSKLEDCQEFQTELRTLFALYARRKDKKRFVEYLRTHEECGHMDDETYGMLAMLTHSDRLQELKKIREERNAEIVTEKEEINMCQAIEEIYEDGIELGREEGGMLKLIVQIGRKLAKGKTPEQIAEELEEDREEIASICRAARQYAPEYDCWKIYELWKAQAAL